MHQESENSEEAPPIVELRKAVAENTAHLKRTDAEEKEAPKEPDRFGSVLGIVERKKKTPGKVDAEDFL